MRKLAPQDWRAGSGVKGAGCSSGRQGFNSQDLHVNLPLFLTLGPADPTPSSGFCRHLHMRYTHMFIHVDQTPTHKIKTNILKRELTAGPSHQEELSCTNPLGKPRKSISCSKKELSLPKLLPLAPELIRKAPGGVILSFGLALYITSQDFLNPPPSSDEAS